MTPDTIFRDASAKQAAMRQYAQAHDRAAEVEQIERGEGHHADATVAHGRGLIALRAWLAEKDDPEPKEPTHA